MRAILAAVVAAITLTNMEGAMAHDLTLTRTIAASPERVWQALTEQDAIAQWWGPTGFTAPRVDVDLRPGGRTVVCMTAPGMPLMCNSWIYSEIVPGERLVFDQGWADAEGAEVDPHTLGFLPADIPLSVPHTISLAAQADGSTVLSWAEFGYASAETAALSQSGLEQVLDKLVRVAEGG
jgi:uncharacterized protein YndB with AHSA1/START domain